MTNITPDQQKALVLLTRAMLDQIDEIASIRAQGGAASISLGMLREMSSVLSDVEPEILDAYLEMLPTLTAHALPSRGVRIDEETAKYLNQPRRGFVMQVREELGIKAA